MAKNKAAAGQYHVQDKVLVGYRAPDEDGDLERPVPLERVWEELYSRQRTGWQPVQAAVPKGVRTIGESAFEGCFGLTAVSIPDTVREIGRQAFRNCDALSGLTIPGSVKTIAYEAFYNCGSLMELTIPDGVTEIGDRAFAYCSSLRQVTIPAGVNIGACAFCGCFALTRLRIAGPAGEIKDGAFQDCTALEELVLPKELCGQAEQLFRDKEQLPWRWLCGKLQVNEDLAAAFAADLRAQRTKVWEKIAAEADGGTLERYLALWDRVPRDFLDQLIEKATRLQRPELTTVLLQYKDGHYLQG